MNLDFKNINQIFAQGGGSYYIRCSLYIKYIYRPGRIIFICLDELAGFNRIRDYHLPAAVFSMAGRLDFRFCSPAEKKPENNRCDSYSYPVFVLCIFICHSLTPIQMRGDTF